MRKYLFMALYVVLVISLLGCNGNFNNTCETDGSASNAGDNTSSYEIVSGTCDTIKEEQDVKVININDSETQFLSCGLKLSEIREFLDRPAKEVVDEIGSDYILLDNNEIFKGYYYENIGINLLEYKKKEELDVTFDVIEFDWDRIVFLGLSKDMNFYEIKKVLGETQIIKIEYGFYGLISYELRYIINGTKVRFIAWDENGERANVNIVKTFNQNGFIQISKNLLNKYFSITKNEILENNTGYGVIYKSNEDYYDINGIRLRFNDNLLESIDFDHNYEIAGIRIGQNLQSVIKFFGPGETEIYEGEDVLIFEIYYFENYCIRYGSDSKDGDIFWIFIESK